MPEDKPDRDESLHSAVARRITRLRRDRGLSLSALALQAGIGKGTLSELEAGTRNPTLGTLYALAGPLGVPLTGLVGDGTGRGVSDDVVEARLLSVRTHDDGGTTEVFWLTIASAGTRVSPAHGPGTVEHFRVVRGSARVGVLGAEQDATAGDALSWHGDTVHSYASTDGGAEGVLTIETPARRDGSGAGHAVIMR
ncbi:helix-turn-helix transcriptional regulator [Arthrobacter sp. SX1312]|uniref:helix-turn-helix domain-containing protein n=1 Tax=Arthrobacter sp. SX1312 TaxID=2058896 RepID=UPI000CE52115|nr:helix-turn-helix transcriptional regulator [Arthrobacter sp. SX1312]